MERLKTQRSDYQVLKDHATGQFYIGQIEIDPDGILCPCSKISGYFDTFEQANQKLGEINGVANVRGS